MKNLILVLLSCLVFVSCSTQTKPPSYSNDVVVQSVIPNESCVALEAEDPTSFSVQLWGQKNKFWPKNTNIRVLFLNGTETQKNETWKRIKLVDDLISISFTRVTSSPSDIRIMFDPKGGHWSYLGTDILNIPQSKKTMNLGFNTNVSSSEYNRVVVHELLHSLGFYHEQQHPSSAIPWDEPKVIAYYSRTQGWTEAQTRAQVLNNHKKTSNFEGSEYDPTSIMHYPVDPALTENGYSVGWNTKLSECDIYILQKVYGKN